eukprot:PhM_4_TR3300/c0_g1_i1/m.23798
MSPRVTVLLLIAIIAAAAVDAQIIGVPTCKVGNIDFTNAKLAQCSGLKQSFNGAQSGPYSFTFFWCQQGTIGTCSGSYVVQSHPQDGGDMCDKGFTSWDTGMVAISNGVKYSAKATDGSVVTTTITCNKNVEYQCDSPYTVTGPLTGPFQFSINMESKYACDGSAPAPGPGPGPGPAPGPSGGEPEKSGFPKGGIFLIVFFVGSALYLSVGFAYNYRMKELRGVEAVPNLEFWKDLPGLCKDGCVYFFELCKSGVARIRGQGSGGGDTYAAV